MSSLPSIVFAPGGCHKPSSFPPTQEHLEKAGYTVIGVDLPGVDAENKEGLPPHNWGPDVEAIRNAVLQQLETGHNVVLVVHSYSGVIGSEAVLGLDKQSRENVGKATSFIRLVYLAAVVMGVGSWLWQHGKPATMNVVDGLALVDKSAAANWFYNDLPLAQSKQLAQDNVLSHVASCFNGESKVTHTAWRIIPSTDLLTENDNTVPLAVQEAMVKPEGALFETERCKAGHSPFASMPEFTAEVIRRAAGEIVSK